MGRKNNGRKEDNEKGNKSFFCKARKRGKMAEKSTESVKKSSLRKKKKKNSKKNKKVEKLDAKQLDLNFFS